MPQPILMRRTQLTLLANKRVKFARTARPTRKSDALLLAAYPRRYPMRRP